MELHDPGGSMVLKLACCSLCSQRPDDSECRATKCNGRFNPLYQASEEDLLLATLGTTFANTRLAQVRSKPRGVKFLRSRYLARAGSQRKPPYTDRYPKEPNHD